jgi:hypothetical protein
MSTLRFSLLSTLGVALLVAPPLAARERKAPADPNRVICRTEEVIGSRLQSKRRCMTAQQWEALRQEERATVERIQAFKPNKGG